MNYKLTVAYDGTRYRGWQRLGEGAQSIQGRLEAVLSRMEGREDIGRPRRMESQEDTCRLQKEECRPAIRGITKGEIQR